MIIGGTDFVIGKAAHGLRITAHVVHDCWPRMVVEDAITGKLFPDYKNIPYEDLSEIFIYRNKRVSKQWEKLGVCKELNGTMIHALCKKELTIVLDDNAFNHSTTEQSQILARLHRAIFWDNMKKRLEDVVNDYFDNAHWRDPYDVYSAILNDRGTLVDNLMKVVTDIEHEDE